MKVFLFAISMLGIGCSGYDQIDSKVVGQAKRYHHYNPIVCGGYDTVDISLGIVRNGVGSMSTEDVELTVWNQADAETLQKAAQESSLVELKYSVWRFAPCKESRVVQYAKILK